MLCGAEGNPRTAADAALPQPGGGAGDAHEEQDERAAHGGGSRVQQTASCTGRDTAATSQARDGAEEHSRSGRSVGSHLALEVGDPQRFPSVGDAVRYCGLTSALDSSADKQKRGPISKQRNAHLQTVLVEAAKVAPRWNPQLAAVHAREVQRGHRNRATLEVARKLVAYLLAVD